MVIVLYLLFCMKIIKNTQMARAAYKCRRLFWLQKPKLNHQSIKAWEFDIYLRFSVQFSSVQFSHSVMSDSLWLYEPQNTRPPWPFPTPGVHPNPCPLCQWCHPTISSQLFLNSNLHQRYQGNISCKDGLDKGQKWYGPNRSRRY